MSVAACTVLLPRKEPAVAERLPRDTQPLPLGLAVRPGTVVVRQGEPSPPTRVVERGALLVEAVRDDGRRLALDVLGPGDGVGAPSGRAAAATVRALGPVRLRAVSTDDDPETMTARRAERATALATDLAWLGVSERVMARLGDLATRFGHPVPAGVAIGLRLTHDDLAALCGTSRETVTRALRSLIEQGCVEVPRRGRFVVRRAHLAHPARGPLHTLQPAPEPSCNRIRLHEPQ